MIVWISSYPKSGNTYIRSFLAAYYFSEKGKFEFDQLINILQFPSLNYSKEDYFNYNDVAKNWIDNQNHFFPKEEIKFLKTHNTLKPYFGEKFTTSIQTLGAIYIVRDPRNLVTSMSHHFSLSQEDAFKKLIDSSASLSEKSINGDCSNFTFLGTWSDHYSSWKNNKEFDVLFLRYEDLKNNSEYIFRKIINFIEKLKNSNRQIDEKKLINSIKSTNFANLRNKELNQGFNEGVFTNNRKRKNFFNLGFKNDWKKLLHKSLIEKINSTLINELEELNY